MVGWALPTSIQVMPQAEIHYRIFKLIEAQPDISQRQLAKALGVSLGKVNHCLKALIDKGQVKVHNSSATPASEATPIS